MFLHSGGVLAGSFASIMNQANGQGTARDTTAQGRPNTGRALLTVPELFALMRGGLYRRLASIRPDWATKGGWSTGDEKVDAVMTRLDLAAKFRRADVWGRGTGEARLYLATGAADPSLPMARNEKIVAVHVLDRMEFRPTPLASLTSIDDAGFGAPEFYDVQVRRAGLLGRRVKVHASRLLDFYGYDTAPSEFGIEGWGDRDAIGQVVFEALAGLDITTNAGARIASELMVSVFKIKGSAGSFTGDDASSWLSRVAAINLMKSVAHSILLGDEDSFERSAANVAGYADLSNQARLMLSAVEGTPQTLLFGMPPSGFSTDGESWQELWYADVAHWQQERYAAHLAKIARQISGSDDIVVRFAPLGELDALERATLRLTVTQADDIALAQGVITVAEVRKRYESEDGRFREELPILPPNAAPPEVDPEVEAGAAALVEAALARPAVAADAADAVGAQLYVGLRIASLAAESARVLGPLHATALFAAWPNGTLETALPVVRRALAIVGAPPLEPELPELARDFGAASDVPAWTFRRGGLLDGWLRAFHGALLGALPGDAVPSVYSAERYRPHVTIPKGYQPMEIVAKLEIEVSAGADSAVVAL